MERSGATQTVVIRAMVARVKDSVKVIYTVTYLRLLIETFQFKPASMGAKIVLEHDILRASPWVG